MSAGAALFVAAALAGCGSTTYFAGRPLPPSKLLNRVMIAIQNPSALTQGALQIVDAYYDTRSGYTGQPPSFSIAGYGGALPISIQNMPEEELGAVYGAGGSGSLSPANYAQEKTTGSVSGLNGPSSSIFMTRNQQFVFAASQQAHVLTVVSQSTGGSYPLNLPGVYRVSVNPGGSVALAFAQNSNYLYYPIQLTTGQTLSYSGGPSTWPLGAVDCEPQNAPGWCLFQALDPSSTKTNLKPLSFDRPVKAVFSADGNTAYVLSCGPECGGTASSITPLPIAPMLFLPGQGSGLLPTQSQIAPCSTNTASSCTLPIPGGSSNALVVSSTMYVVGQKPQTVNAEQLFSGNLTVLNLSVGASGWASVTTAAAISDGQPGAVSRMLEADDNTLWIGMSGCTVGVRYATNPAGGYGCLTMFNTSTNTVTMLEPYIGDATGIAAVTGLHKIYAAEGGQVYIYSTTDCSTLDNQFVTVTGTAYDVAYMDAITDTDNTVY